MNPKKSRVLHEQIAKNVGFDLTDVEDINKAYWKFVREKLSSLEYPKIYISGLGSMLIKKKAVGKKLETFVAKEAYWRNVGEGTKIHLEVAKDLKSIQRLSETIKKEQDRKTELKKHKLYNGEKDFNRNMEGEEPDC